MVAASYGDDAASSSAHCASVFANVPTLSANSPNKVFDAFAEADR
jgi:hypothetical protein